ncbi:MAG: Fic family protein [candidate division Zixibacteria bacterium]|nr:Fic family protein [candidate division Zixibacteria bacterium]
MEKFTLEKPYITENTFKKAIGRIIDAKAELGSHITKIHSPKYLYWDKARYQSRPKGITAEEFWMVIQLLRHNSPNRSETIILDKNGRSFTWQPLPELDRNLHEIDMDLGGTLESKLIDDKSTRQRFITRGIMEEAIASSQLEGASTTRKVAKRMLIERRAPRNKSEQMILNNYRAMLAIENEYRNEPMSVDLLLTLHKTLTVDTISKDEVGRLRKDKDEVVVCDPVQNLVYHVPPDEQLLKKELKRFINYANDKLDKQRFIHPLIKAIFLHFWFAYLHPFTDGNGRLARIIFLWYLLRNNYWGFSYLPISQMIRKSPAQYRDAYVYTEQDNNDLTYFIDYLIRKILMAKKEFNDYVKRSATSNRKMVRVARERYQLNDRQIQLLKYLYKNPGVAISINTHSHVNGVSRPTANKDLQELENLGFLKSQKIGRDRPFRSTPKASELF